MARPQLTEEEKRLFEAFLMPKVADPNLTRSSFDVAESTSPTVARGGFSPLDIKSVTGPNDFAPYGAEQIQEPSPEVPMIPPPMVEEPAPKVASLPAAPGPVAAPVKKVPNDSDIIKSFLAAAENPPKEEDFNPMGVIGQAVAGFGDAMVARGGGKGGALERTIGIQDKMAAAEKEKKALADMNDPNSAKSKAYQALLKEMFPDMDVSKLSASQAEKVMGPLGQVVEKREGRKAAEEQRRLQRETLQAERDRRFGERQDKIGVDLLNKFNQDPGVRKIESSIDAANNIRELATSGNPIAANAIPTYMARASGEVGNLSEADKRPFGGSQAILARLEATFKQATTGQLSEDNRRYILALADTMEKRASANKDRRAREWADQYSQVTPVGADEIYSTLRPGPRGGAQPAEISEDVRSGAAAELARRRGKG